MFWCLLAAGVCSVTYPIICLVMHDCKFIVPIDTSTDGGVSLTEQDELHAVTPASSQLVRSFVKKGISHVLVRRGSPSHLSSMDDTFRAVLGYKVCIACVACTRGTLVHAQ